MDNRCTGCMENNNGCDLCNPKYSPSYVVHDAHKNAQMARNLEAAQMAEDAAMGIKNFTPAHYENGGEDFLARAFRTYTPEELRGAMKFIIGKYPDRLGKKDDEVKELTKIIDYATRYKNHLLGETK